MTNKKTGKPYKVAVAGLGYVGLSIATLLAQHTVDYVVIATPTNYDSKKNFFDTSAVEAVMARHSLDRWW